MSKACKQRQVHTDLSPDMERRETPRFGCDRGAQCWRDGSSAAFWGALVDLSMTGCSLQVTKPVCPGTRLRMVLMLFGKAIRASGIVRTQKENVIGVAFSTLTEIEQAKLTDAVQRLADGRNTNSHVLMNTQAAVLRLRRWFRNHDVLTRELFERMLEGDFDPALESAAAPMIKQSAPGAVRKLAESLLRW